MLVTLVGCAAGPVVELIHESGFSKFPKGKIYILVEEDMDLFLPGFSALIKEKFPKALASKGVDSELLTKDNLTASSREVAYLMRVRNSRPDWEAVIYEIIVIISLGNTDLYIVGIILNPKSTLLVYVLQCFTGLEQTSCLSLYTLLSRSPSQNLA